MKDKSNKILRANNEVADEIADCLNALNPCEVLHTLCLVMLMALQGQKRHDGPSGRVQLARERRDVRKKVKELMSRKGLIRLDLLYAGMDLLLQDCTYSCANPELCTRMMGEVTITEDDVKDACRNGEVEVVEDCPFYVFAMDPGKGIETN